MSSGGLMHLSVNLGGHQLEVFSEQILSILYFTRCKLNPFLNEIKSNWVG